MRELDLLAFAADVVRIAFAVKIAGKAKRM